MDPQTFEFIASSILHIPSFIGHLYELLHRVPHKESEEGTHILEQLKAAVIQYAELHFELEDWKLIHDHLHDLQVAFSGIEEFRGFLTIPLEPSRARLWPDIIVKWEFYRGYLNRFHDGCRSIRYIPSFQLRLSQEDYSTGDIQEIDVMARIRDLEGFLTRSIRNQRFDDSGGYFREFRHVLENAMVAANGNIRLLADRLAKLSIELKAHLE
jgi:hypothetical protein